MSVSHDSGAFSNDSLFQTSSLGHGLQKGSVKSRTIPSCCPDSLPCLHVCGEPVVSWDAGPYQQKLKPSSTPGFLFSSLSLQWKHSQTNANLKKGLCRPIIYCDIVSMSLLPGCEDFWLFSSLFAKYTVLYHIYISEDQNGKKTPTLLLVWESYYWENIVLFLKSEDNKSSLCFMTERFTIAVIYVHVQIQTDLYIKVCHAVMQDLVMRQADNITF